VKRLNDCVHPFVLKCYGYAKSESGDWMILLEHAANGDIQSYYETLRQMNGGDLPYSAISKNKRIELVW
jgi:serine/threonine protein kinase